MKGMAAIAVALWLSLIMSSGWPQASAKTRNKARPADASSAQTELASTPGPDYVIGADDVLHISVWKEPELTETLPVRPDGKISIPLLGDVQAAGLTPVQLSLAITERLKKYVADPRVTVAVTDMKSQRIYVLGEVLHTGAMPLLPGMTVLQALATAGLSQFTNTKGIYLLRTVNGRTQRIPIPYKQLLKGEAMEGDIALRPGDTLVVP